MACPFGPITTADLAIFERGSLWHTAVIAVGGDHFTNDIAVALRTPTHHAEDIKIRYACALTQLANPEETIEVPSVGDRPPRRLVRSHSSRGTSRRSA